MLAGKGFALVLKSARSEKISIFAAAAAIPPTLVQFSGSLGLIACRLSQVIALQC
jgi:hypothetical protein